MTYYKKDFIAFQNSVATSYGKETNTIDEILRVLVAAKLKNIAGRILDVGCGNGCFLEKLKSYSLLIKHGLDFAPEMLKIANEKLSQDVRLLFSDATRIPFYDDTFDYIVCLNMLFNHPTFEDMKPIIKALLHVCRPSGVVFFDLYNTKNPFIYFLTKRITSSKRISFGGKGVSFSDVKRFLKNEGVSKIKKKYLYNKNLMVAHKKRRFYFFVRVVYVLIPFLRPRYLVIVTK
ncbi:class I SAM-dependent methyltransferase [Chlamydiota bacterium]